MEIVTFMEKWLGKLRALCNRGLRYDAFSDWTMRRCTVNDPNFDPNYGLVAMERDEPIGLMLGVRRIKVPSEWVERDKRIGWIKLLCADPDYPKRAQVEGEMLKELEKRFKADGVKVVRATDFASWFFFPGIDIRYQDQIDFLLSKGFRKESSGLDYKLDITEFTIPEYLKRLEERRVSEGFIFRQPEKNEKERITSWICKFFSPAWAYETGLSFRFDQPKVWLIEREGEIIGFSAYSALEPYWFGPIGVREDHRKKGLGTILLFKSLFSLREDGQKMVVIPWIEREFLLFYSQIPGIKGIRYYWIMTKELR